MAVAAPSLFHIKPDIWRPGNASSAHLFEHSAHLFEHQQPMTEIMTYQYPPPPLNGHDMEMPPSGYIPNYSIPPQSSGMDMRLNAHSGPAGRPGQRDFFDLKHSVASPHDKSGQLRQNQDDSSDNANMGLSGEKKSGEKKSGEKKSGEKKRNPLGYHRTSVACGKTPSLGCTETGTLLGERR